MTLFQKLSITLTNTTKKMKFSIKDFFSKCDQIRSFTFTEQILNGKLHFFCSVTRDLLDCTRFPIFVINDIIAENIFNVER